MIKTNFSTDLFAGFGIVCSLYWLCLWLPIIMIYTSIFYEIYKNQRSETQTNDGTQMETTKKAREMETNEWKMPKRWRCRDLVKWFIMHFFRFFFRVCCCSLLLQYLLVFIGFSIQFKVDFLSLSFFSLIIVKSIVLCASKCIIMKEIVMLYLCRNMHQHRVMRSETQTILWLLFF